MSGEVERVTIIFTGDVQGVGFRYTTANVARLYPQVKGEVAKLSDGTVKLVLEGKKADILRFIESVYGYMTQYITDKTERWELISPMLTTFRITG